MSTASRAAWAAFGVTAAAGVMVAVDLGRRILANNDEARFALLAQDVLSRGEWMSPQLNGAVYTNKPPLLAWLIAAASWPAGHVTQLTAALPSALAAVATALVVFAAGRSLFGATTGIFAALVTVTTQGWFLHARLPMPDMLLTLFITAAVAALWPTIEGRRGPWWLGVWVAMAAAFWAKGAAALLPLAVALAWGIGARRPRWWQAMHWPAGLALFALLIAPWWIGKLATHGEAMRETIVIDNLLWYLPRSPLVLVGVSQHVVGILFPWALVLPLVGWLAVKAVRRRTSDGDALVFVFAWALALLVCVGVVQQQRLRYYLPLVPPVALLIGWWGARAVSEARTKDVWSTSEAPAVGDARARGEARSLGEVRVAGVAPSVGDAHAEAGIPWRAYATLVVVVALATAAAALIRPTWVNADHVAFPMSIVEVGVMGGGLATMVAALAWGLRYGPLRRTFAIACLGSAAWVVGWYHWELERRNAISDYPRLRAEARRLLPEDPVVATWGVYDLPLSFYLGRPVKAIHTDRDLRRVMSEHPRASAVLTRTALAQVEDPARLRVLPLERMNLDSIVLVSYSPDVPRAGTRP